MTIQVTYPKPTHPATHPAKYAVIQYAERMYQARDAMIDAMCDAGKFDHDKLGEMTSLVDEADNLKYNIFNCTLNYAEAEASRLWADFCQAHQLCLECGGELVMEHFNSSGRWYDPCDDTELLLCRECGAVSNWKQPVCETGEELPF